jgi:hypothetical protein
MRDTRGMAKSERLFHERWEAEQRRKAERQKAEQHEQHKYAEVARDTRLEGSR